MSKRVKRVPRVVMSKLVRRVRESKDLGRIVSIDLGCVPKDCTLEEFMTKLKRVLYGS